MKIKDLLTVDAIALGVTAADRDAAIDKLISFTKPLAICRMQQRLRKLS